MYSSIVSPKHEWIALINHAFWCFQIAHTTSEFSTLSSSDNHIDDAEGLATRLLHTVHLFRHLHRRKRIEEIGSRRPVPLLVGTSLSRFILERLAKVLPSLLYRSWCVVLSSTTVGCQLRRQNHPRSLSEEVDPGTREDLVIAFRSGPNIVGRYK
jgi:hypothetical protein